MAAVANGGRAPEVANRDCESTPEKVARQATAPEVCVDQAAMPCLGQSSAVCQWLENRVPAQLTLADGSTFSGFSFGHNGATSGEVVFNTGMTGYPESLTDPSYAGQVLVLTFPLVGNYGVPSEERDANGMPVNFESEQIWIKGLVVSEYSFTCSHYTACRTLSDWLQSQHVPAIYGVDTRELTKQIRTHGAILGRIDVGLASISKLVTPTFDDPNLRNLAAEVSRSTKVTFESPSLPGQDDSAPRPHILAVDLGCKFNIIRYFLNFLRVRLTVVPWDYDFTEDEFDGLFLSNGPGNPEQCEATIKHVRTIMQKSPRTPIFGICLGNQILALAAGFTTYKMKFGNRGMNQPCVDLRTSRCYITPQNHGFAVDGEKPPPGWQQFFINANDGSNEGVIHCQLPWYSVQFHPEARGGPTDTAFLFEHFIHSITAPSFRQVTTLPYQIPVVRRKVLVLGNGGITIGQAGEFDYSGSQAIKALREAGAFSILVNPNIATVQTGLADRVYFLPVTPEFVEQVIKRERPDGILCTFGGQTALNCGLRLDEQGIFKKYGVDVLGTQMSTIITTEDRELFAKAVDFCGYKVAESYACNTVEEAEAAAATIGYPVLCRSAFALGGLGSGFANNQAELVQLVKTALVNSPQVIIDRSMKGWKELEYEVVRDRNDNCITVCNMENFDPCGVHTGDSIVIAPSQTLTNDEYFRLRECALKVIRHLGVVGECNIQYAVDPLSHEFRIIEVNARLSRSSALASKATGYPLAYVAAKLALGSDLVTIRNSVTKKTTACFEPSLDYVVVKVPRWDLRKFTTVDQKVGSCMKSVGEVMAIGRNFEEVIQKALRMVDENCIGFDSQRFDAELKHRGLPEEEAHVRAELAAPTPMRIWAIAKAFDMGMNLEEVRKITAIDTWFLQKLLNIHAVKKALGEVRHHDLQSQPRLLREAKRLGFADRQIAAWLRQDSSAAPFTEKQVRAIRHHLGVTPVVKQIDTLAAEFPAETNYLYITYGAVEHDVDLRGFRNRSAGSSPKLDPVKSDGGLSLPAPISLSNLNIEPALAKKTSKSKILVLGCGCYRIGSSVEFDWCSVSCVKSLRALGHEAIIVNCNPETVSTDYDESDRLYFEELSHETVLDIVELEQPDGTIISVGGQTPNNLAIGLHNAGVKILGTSVWSIDACENRQKFSKLCDSLRVDQPEWSQFTTIEEAFGFTRNVGYPVLVRPSYVLSGAAMRVVASDDELQIFLATAAVVSREYPVVISKYIEGAKEVEFDGVGQNGELLNYAIAEHIENAGCHSGDATHILPAQKLFVETIRRVKAISQKVCRALKISGPFNIQFMCKENEVKVIECNLRASRSLPFISKTYNVNFVDLATRVMVGMNVRSAAVQPIDMEYVCCKVPMFSFLRLKGSDPRLGVEMQSTGEVACFGLNQYEAFLTAMLAAGFKLPAKNIMVSIGPDQQKNEFAINCVSMLREMGFQLYATKSTCESLKKNGFESCVHVNKPFTRREPNAITLLRAGKIDLVINVPSSMDSEGATDGFEIRRAALDTGVPLLTNIKTIALMVQALHRKWTRERAGKTFWSYRSWQEHALGEPHP
jgi:carbamoyl-phosphate synthase small subunit